jgi:hypothetical protein
MPHYAFTQAPRWKQALAVICLLYVLGVWVLPLLMLPFVHILPFVHQTTVLERLPASVIGTSFLIVAFLVLNGATPRARGAASGGKQGNANWKGAVSHWLGVFAGLAMFTYTAAAFSGNLFGLAAKILPREPYSAKVVIDAASHSGSRYRSVTLEYNDPVSGARSYLVLSARLFDYPAFQPGDVVELRGYSTLIGIYVTGFALLEDAQKRSG